VYAVILEDDPLRVAPMRDVLSTLLPTVHIVAFDAIPTFHDFLHRHGHETVLLCLDCDLTRPCPDVPPDLRGDGRDAATLLADYPPFCPVIVHSSNYNLVPFMLERLRAADWHTTLVTPCSDPEYAWVETEWKATVAKLLDTGWIQFA